MRRRSDINDIKSKTQINNKKSTVWIRKFMTNFFEKELCDCVFDL
jgi:hypothetical protein